MSEPRWREEVANRVWQLQLIVGALAAGSLMFLGIVLFLVHFGAAPERPAGEQGPLLLYLLLAFTLAGLAARAVVPQVMASASRRRIREGVWQPNPSGTVPLAMQEFFERTGDAGKLWQVLLTRTIVAAAILEGIAFFACITYMLEHSFLSLMIAVVFIASVALHVPTQAGAIHWIEGQMRLLEEEKQFGR